MLSLLVVDGFEQVDDSESQESNGAAEGNCFMSELVCTQETGQNLPTRMLTLPAMARPPITATAVHMPWPKIAPPVTHQ